MKTLTISLLALFVAMSFSTIEAGAQTKKFKKRRAEAYRYLNEIRKNAGLVPFTRNKSLQRAAQSHADYLTINQVTKHKQSRIAKRFSGRRPVDRVRKYGYTHKIILENVSGRQRNVLESVDSLMNGVYRRFGFLSFLHDEIGIGFTLRDQKSRYTYNMGFRDLSKVCIKPPRKATKIVSGRALAHCFYKKVRIDSEYFQDLQTKLLLDNPKVVLWPYDGAIDVLPNFFEDDPDPLPEYGVSGSPVSVQFNPFFFKKVKLIAFRIFHHPGKVLNRLPYPKKRRRIKNVRILDRKTDPNKVFKPYQFALFSLEPFQWKSWYEAVAIFKADGVRETYRWHFRTRDLGMPMYTVKGKGEVLPVQSNKKYAFYLPPVRKRPGFAEVTVTVPRGVNVKHRGLDKNTHWVWIKAQRCQKIKVTFPRGEFTLRVAAMDNVRKIHKAKELYAGCRK